MVEIGNLIAKDGVTFQAIYSKFVDLWATATYQDSPFPFNALDALSGQYLIGIDAGGNANGWKWLNDTTREMVRDSGWEEYNGSGGLTIKDSDHIDDTCTIEIAQGSLTFDSSCTAGTMIARGACKFLDETNGATVIDETILYDANVDLSEVNTKLDNITNNLGLTAEQHNQLMQLVNYDDKQLKNLAYVILGA